MSLSLIAFQLSKFRAIFPQWQQHSQERDSSHWLANEVCWRTVRRLCGSKSNITRSITDLNSVLSKSYEEDILARWREYSADLLNPGNLTASDTQEVHLMGRKYRQYDWSLSCQKSGSWQDRRFVMKSNLKWLTPSTEKEFLDYSSCVSSGLAIWNGTEGLANCSGHPHT